MNEREKNSCNKQRTVKSNRGKLENNLDGNKRFGDG